MEIGLGPLRTKYRALCCQNPTALCGAKGDKVRQVLLPAAIGRQLLAARGDAPPEAPVFESTRRPRQPLSLPVISSCTSPLSRGMTWRHSRLTSSVHRQRCAGHAGVRAANRRARSGGSCDPCVTVSVATLAIAKEGVDDCLLDVPGDLLGTPFLRPAPGFLPPLPAIEIH